MGTYIIIPIFHNSVKLMMHTLSKIEAGPTSGLRSTGCQRVSENIPASYKKKEADGALTIYRNYIVKGKCMEPKDIKEGNIVEVRILNKTDRSYLVESALYIIGLS